MPFDSMFWHAEHFDAQHESICASSFAPFGYFASHAAMQSSTVPPPPDAVPPEVPPLVPPLVPPEDPLRVGEPLLVANVPDDPLLLELLDESSLLEHAVNAAAARTKAAAAAREIAPTIRV